MKTSYVSIVGAQGIEPDIVEAEVVIIVERNTIPACMIVKNPKVMVQYSQAIQQQKKKLTCPPLFQLELKETRSGKNFISRDAIRKLQVSAIRQELKEIITVNGTHYTEFSVW